MVIAVLRCASEWLGAKTISRKSTERVKTLAVRCGSRAPARALSTQADSSQDLVRFLNQVGTDRREARYWLQQFRQQTSASSVFTVVHVPLVATQADEQLDKLASSLSFLHRNNLSPVIVYGLPRGRRLNSNNNVAANGTNGINSNEVDGSQSSVVSTQTLRLAQGTGMTLADALGKYGTYAQLLPSHCTLQAEVDQSGCFTKIAHVDTQLLRWSISSGYIPLLPSLACTLGSQLVHVDTLRATVALSRALQPFKVILLTQRGGLLDSDGSTISQVNSPAENEELLSRAYCTPAIKEKIKMVFSLLDDLPEQSSVVITSPTTVLQELFTFHGSGTIFQKRERVLEYDSLEQVDLGRLHDLLERSFQKKLKADYFTHIGPKLCRLYLSERYNFAAIVLDIEESAGIPYLDKFAVAEASQGVGSAQALWELLNRDFPALFWRSSPTNRINSWYFERCKGSLTTPQWTVFWYGVEQDQETLSRLVNIAKVLPPTFERTMDENSADQMQTSSRHSSKIVNSDIEMSELQATSGGHPSISLLESL